MKPLQLCAAATVFAVLFAFTTFAPAQTGTFSDSLSEAVVDLAGANVPLAPPTVSFPIPEGQEPVDLVFPLPGRQIDFVEETPVTNIISDRLSISPYEVRVASDPNPGGLPPRTNAIRIPASALESFLPLSILAKSDGNAANPVQELSDSLTITLGSYGPGTGTVIFSEVIPEPLPEGVTEPVLGFVIPPTLFDIVEPPGETGGVDGIISDYVDLLTQIEVRFISSDDPALYANLPPAQGFIVESITAGGGIHYYLDFRSDAIPEPCAIGLIGVAATALVTLRRRS